MIDNVLVSEVFIWLLALVTWAAPHVRKRDFGLMLWEALHPILRPAVAASPSPRTEPYITDASRWAAGLQQAQGSPYSDFQNAYPSLGEASGQQNALFGHVYVRPEWGVVIQPDDIPDLGLRALVKYFNAKPHV